jgi:hypothetical protein
VALTFPQILLVGALVGIVLHVLFLGRFVARRESFTSEHIARVVIFFSGLWFIGLFVYFGFRNTRPLLAQACLRQMIAVTGLWVVLVILSLYGFDFWGAGNAK